MTASLPPEPTTAPPSASRLRATSRFAGRTAQLHTLRQELDRAEQGLRVVVVRGEAGVGKTTLLRRFGWQAQDEGRRVAWISGDEVAPSPAAVSAAVAAGLGVADPWPVLGNADRADVVVLDAAEGLWPCVAWVFGTALARSGRRLLVLLSSRTAVPPKVRSLVSLAAPVTEVPVEDFSGDELAEALRLRALPETLTADVEARCTRSPLAFALLCEHYERTGALPKLNSADDPWTLLAREFLRAAASEAQATALKALALASALDVPLLRAMLDVVDAQPLHGFLAGLSFVEQTPRGLVLHRLVRRAIFDGLWRAEAPLRERLTARAIDHLTRCPPAASLTELLDGMIESLYVGRRPAYSNATLFLDDLRRHGLRPAREADLPWVREAIAAFEGAESVSRFDEVYRLQPERLFIVTDEDDEGAALLFAVDPGALPVAVRAQDAVLTHAAALFSGDPGFVARWWLTRHGGQGFSPSMTALMVAGAPVTAKLPPHRYALFAVAEPERWAPLSGPFGLRRVPLDVPFPSHTKGLYLADLNEALPDALGWPERARGMLRFHAQGFAALSSAGTPAWPSQDALTEAVRDALPQLRHPLELADSPLAACASFRDAGTVDDVPSGVRRLLEETLTALDAVPGYAQDAAVLRATYFGPSAKHEAIALDLGMPFGTFRHRLRRATGRFVELAWRRELAKRRGGVVEPLAVVSAPDGGAPERRGPSAAP